MSDKSEETYKFLDSFYLSKLNQVYIKYLNRAMVFKFLMVFKQWVLSYKKEFPNKENMGLGGFTTKFYQTKMKS
jgi:hypothetical protein